MVYKSLRAAALALLVLLFIMLSNAVKEDVQPVMVTYSSYISIETLARSIDLINTIEYKQIIRTPGSSNNPIEMHYYYKRPNFLRVETNNNGKISVDIYTPTGMYEYFPQSKAAYYREKWKDDKPISFQLEDKLQDIKIRGKYELLKNERLSGVDCEVIRNVFEEGGSVCEHRLWLGEKGGIKLPIKEEFLIDGEVTMAYEYEYISVNRELDGALFALKQSDNIKIYNAEGIPKIVKDEKEAESYVKFDVYIPKYIPLGFKINEISIIPPVKSATVLITYISDMEMIYYSQKKTDKFTLTLQENDKVIDAGGMKFAVRKLFNDSVSVRWIKNGIEYEFTGNNNLKDEIIKLVQSVSGKWVTV